MCTEDNGPKSELKTGHSLGESFLVWVSRGLCFKTGTQADICTVMFIAALFTTAKQ